MIALKLWVDDLRVPPAGWRWAKSVHEAKTCLCQMVRLTDNGDKYFNVDVISLDHDAGNYAFAGGDYINILNWLEEKSEEWNIVKMPKFNLHSKNVVGVQNMRAIIEHNGWVEV